MIETILYVDQSPQDIDQIYNLKTTEFDGLWTWGAGLVLAVSDGAEFRAAHQGTLCGSVRPRGAQFELDTGVDDGVAPRDLRGAFRVVHVLMKRQMKLRHSSRPILSLDLPGRFSRHLRTCARMPSSWLCFRTAS